MSWKLYYKGFTVEGLNHCNECIVNFHTDKFEWQTMHKSYRSAQVAITKHLQQERMAAIATQYKLKEATK